MRRFFLAALAAFSLAPFLAAPAAQAAPVWSYVWIESLLSGHCVAVQDAVPGSQPVKVTPCADANYQLWDVLLVSSGKYTVRNTGSGLCLAAQGGALGSPIVQVACGAGSAQLWYLSGSGNHFSIRNVSTGRCMNAQSGPNGSPVLQANCPGVTNPNYALLF
ncbi:RICIN domain-containing protein [Longispora albida]|uniref:RICIN domain-containing protein n=1 Tax=Longispora albida TaxID=203523 RepID=UPI0003801313|nr:RICIN domain-containing protein [Longispora albida]